MMRYAFALAILSVLTYGAQAQDAVPDLKGTWSGKGKSVVFGSNAYHSGKAAISGPPRVRDIEVIYVVEGQDGRLVWGRVSTAAAKKSEPFAWAIASDNRTVIGADMDGYYRVTIDSADRIEKCYAHNAAQPSRSIVAGCHMLDRVKR